MVCPLLRQVGMPGEKPDYILALRGVQPLMELGPPYRVIVSFLRASQLIDVKKFRQAQGHSCILIGATPGGWVLQKQPSFVMSGKRVGQNGSYCRLCQLLDFDHIESIKEVG